MKQLRLLKYRTITSDWGWWPANSILMAFAMDLKSTEFGGLRYSDGLSEFCELT